MEKIRGEARDRQGRADGAGALRSDFGPTGNGLAQPRLVVSADMERPPQRPAQGPHADARGPESEIPALPRRQLPRGEQDRGALPVAEDDWARSKIGPATPATGAIARATAWGCWSFYEWCEDMGAEPVLGVYAGLFARSGDHVKPGPDLVPFVQEALDEIEYVIGDTSTMGRERAKNGHPEPFAPTMSKSATKIGSTRRRPTTAATRNFTDAIKARYPQLKLISTVG